MLNAIPLDILSKVGSLDHTRDLFSICWGIIILFYIVTASVYITNSVQEFSFFHILPNFIYFYLFFFKFYFIFKLYITVLVLPNIKMNPSQVYMCSPTWTLLTPPSPYHPSGSSQCTSPKHPVSCLEPGLASFKKIR